MDEKIKNEAAKKVKSLYKTDAEKDLFFKGLRKSRNPAKTMRLYRIISKDSRDLQLFNQYILQGKRLDHLSREFFFVANRDYFGSLRVT